MKEQNHILVTTDFSQVSFCAFEHAIDYVKTHGQDKTKCTVLTVLEDLGADNQFQLAETIIESHGIDEELAQEAEQNLKEVKEKYFADIEVDLVVLKTKKKAVHTQLLEWAEENNVDRIVIASHGLTGVIHALLGSVTEKIIRESKIPILVVPVPKTEKE